MPNLDFLKLSDIEKYQITYAEQLSSLDAFNEDAYNLFDILDSNFNECTNTIVRSREFHFLSAQNTLHSIIQCCKIGSFSDAHMLIRKYRDDLFQALYFHLQIEKYEIALATNKTISSDFAIEIDVIKKWHSPKEKISKEHLEKYISAECYKQTFYENKFVKKLCRRFFNGTWETISGQANNYTHSNSLIYIQSNSGQIAALVTADRHLIEIEKQLKELTLYFISILFITNSHQFRSSDYIDCLDMGITPPDGSQYWLPSAIQDFFDKYLGLVDPQLKDYLKDKNIYCMHID